MFGSYEAVFLIIDICFYQHFAPTELNEPVQFFLLPGPSITSPKLQTSNFIYKHSLSLHPFQTKFYPVYKNQENFARIPAL